MSQGMKVAIVHDWLPLIGGAEQVLKQMMAVYPDADVYTLFDFLTDEQRESLGVKNVTTSFLNKWPKVHKYYRKIFPFFPLAVEDFDLYDYDLVLSSSHAVAKGVITGAHQVHVSYVHSPVRYAWDFTHRYLRQTGFDKGLKGIIVKYLLSRLRLWDYRTANGVDRFIANSGYIRNRIWKVYRRESDVVHPPINLSDFEFTDQKEDFYLTASRMVPYKRIDLVAESFAKMPDKKLVIIGDGPELDKIQKIADGADNIELLNFQSIEMLKDNMKRAKAFVFAAEEDFGIIPVEAQACGTPVIAFGKGGALETVMGYEYNPAHASGLFFAEQTTDSVIEAVERFENIAHDIKAENCHINAQKFVAENFRHNLKSIVDEEMKKKYG
jgi:glycosyltransferase involved in cell wall biosynthesis